MPTLSVDEREAVLLEDGNAGKEAEELSQARTFKSSMVCSEEQQSVSVAYIGFTVLRKVYPRSFNHSLCERRLRSLDEITSPVS